MPHPSATPPSSRLDVRGGLNEVKDADRSGPGMSAKSTMYSCMPMPPTNVAFGLACSSMIRIYLEELIKLAADFSINGALKIKIMNLDFNKINYTYSSDN